MKVYLACSITNNHDPVLLRKVVDAIQAQGHRVLSEHVAAPSKEESTAILFQNADLETSALKVLNPEQVALIIRDTDFRWIEECDAFIALFFGGSDGRGAEYEHIRYLLELRIRYPEIGVCLRGECNCRGILGIFDKNSISRLIWAANHREREYYRRVLVDPNNIEEVLAQVTEFLFAMEKKEVVYA